MSEPTFIYDCSSVMSDSEIMVKREIKPDMDKLYEVLDQFPRMRENPSDREKMIDFLKQIMDYASEMTMYMAVERDKPLNYNHISVLLIGDVISVHGVIKNLTYVSQDVYITKGPKDTVYMDVSLSIDAIDEM